LTGLENSSKLWASQYLKTSYMYCLALAEDPWIWGVSTLSNILRILHILFEALLQFFKIDHLAVSNTKCNMYAASTHEWSLNEPSKKPDSLCTFFASYQWSEHLLGCHKGEYCTYCWIVEGRVSCWQVSTFSQLVHLSRWQPILGAWWIASWYLGYSDHVSFLIMLIILALSSSRHVVTWISKCCHSQSTSAITRSPISLKHLIQPCCPSPALYLQILSITWPFFNKLFNKMLWWWCSVAQWHPTPLLLPLLLVVVPFPLLSLLDWL